MKKIFSLLIVLSVCISVYAQGRNDTFGFSLGINAINNTGARSPFKNTDNWAFEQPISLGFEYRFSELFAVEALLSHNKFSSNSTIDGIAIVEDHNYFSEDVHIKQYIGEYFLNSEKIDLFLNGGFGFYQLVSLHASANLGVGVSYRLSDALSIRIQSMGKFKLGQKDGIYDSNLIQHFLQLVYWF